MRTWQSFCFPDLTADDFYDPAPGSRGKARLKKSSAFKKCTPLVGGFENLREQYLKRYSHDMNTAETASQRKKAEQKHDLWYNKDDSYRIELEVVDEL